VTFHPVTLDAQARNGISEMQSKVTLNDLGRFNTLLNIWQLNLHLVKPALLLEPK
jgi:hypothetical protein